MKPQKKNSSRKFLLLSPAKMENSLLIIFSPSSSPSNGCLRYREETFLIKIESGNGSDVEVRKEQQQQHQREVNNSEKKGKAKLKFHLELLKIIISFQMVKSSALSLDMNSKNGIKVISILPTSPQSQALYPRRRRRFFITHKTRRN